MAHLQATGVLQSPLSGAMSSSEELGKPWGLQVHANHPMRSCSVQLEIVSATFVLANLISSKTM